MPAKNLFKIYAIGFGIVVVTVVVIVMALIHSGSTATTSQDLVRIQVRSFPAMKRVLMNGREMGKTPKMLLVPRGKELDIQVWFDQLPKSKHITATDDAVVDFTPTQNE